MIGTGLALGLGALASTGAQLAGAKIGSNAAKDAAKIQSQASDRAMNTMGQAYAPYLQAGASSMGMLGRLTGASPNARYASQPLPPAAGMAPQPMPARPPARPQFSGMGPQGPVPMGGSMGGMMGQTVRLQSPDGEVRDVPAYLAQRAMAAGARRVA